MVDTLEVDDPEQRFAAVRLCSDLPLPERDFVRDNGSWVCGCPTTGWPASSTSSSCWITKETHTSYATPITPGERREHSARSPSCGRRTTGRRRGSRSPECKEPSSRSESACSAGRLEIGVWSPGDGELPMLVAHDGPEYAELAGLTRYAGRDDRARHAAAVPGGAASARRPQRVVLGVGRIRTGALVADPGRGARCGRRRRPAGWDGSEPRRARDAAGPADLARNLCRPVPSIGELLRAAL